MLFLDSDGLYSGCIRHAALCPYGRADRCRYCSCQLCETLERKNAAMQSATHLFPDIIEILRNFSFAASFLPGHFLMSGENFIADRFWKRIRSVSQNMIMQKINFSTCSVISAVQNIFSFPGSATFIEKMKHPYPAGTVQIPASVGLRWHAI